MLREETNPSVNSPAKNQNQESEIKHSEEQALEEVKFFWDLPLSLHVPPPGFEPGVLADMRSKRIA